MDLCSRVGLWRGQAEYLEGVMLTALPFAAVGLTLHMLVVGCAFWSSHKVRPISG